MSIQVKSYVIYVFSGDDTLKTWDMRNFRKPVNVATGLTNYFAM